jgi:hypothetical protein
MQTQRLVFRRSFISVLRQCLTADTLAKGIIRAGVLNVEKHRCSVTGGETGEGKYSSLAAGWSSSSWIARWMGQTLQVRDANVWFGIDQESIVPRTVEYGVNLDGGLVGGEEGHLSLGRQRSAW